MKIRILLATSTALTAFFCISAQADVVETCVGTAYAPIGHSTQTVKIISDGKGKLEADFSGKLFPVTKEEATAPQINSGLLDLYSRWSASSIVDVRTLTAYSIFTSGTGERTIRMDVLRNSNHEIIFAGYASKEFPGIQFYHFCAPFKPKF